MVRDFPQHLENGSVECLLMGASLSYHHCMKEDCPSPSWQCCYVQHAKPLCAGADAACNALCRRGHSFYTTNAEILERYADCNTAAEVIAAQNAYLEEVMTAGPEWPETDDDDDDDNDEDEGAYVSNEDDDHSTATSNQASNDESSAGPSQINKQGRQDEQQTCAVGADEVSGHQALPNSRSQDNSQDVITVSDTSMLQLEQPGPSTRPQDGATSGDCSNSNDLESRHLPGSCSNRVVCKENGDTLHNNTEQSTNGGPCTSDITSVTQTHIMQNFVALQLSNRQA